MWKLLITLCAGYALLVAIVYVMQDRMLYLASVPGRALTLTPSDAGMDYEDVFLETADGVKLHGWFIQGHSRRVVLFFHGNAGNISHRLDSIRQFRSLGFSVLIIDYRGYGQSEGRTTEDGLYRDADAAWRYLTGLRGLHSGDIVIFGRSLGASVAARLATQQPALALIVESSFTSVPDIAQELYSWLPARWLSRLSHATRDYVGDVDIPVLVVHSRDDEIIPFHHGEAIYAAANEPRAMLELRGSHNDGFIQDEATYLRGLSSFLDGLPSAAFPRGEKINPVPFRTVDGLTESAMDESVITEFATRYTAAWCSQQPESVAAFFAEGGSLQVNDDAPSVGREAITGVARSFMTTFPDMVLTMDKVIVDQGRAEYHWTLTGTNSGPDGNGNRVRISGYEEWTFGADGLIEKSLGHFNAAEYQRQLEQGADS